MNNLSEKEDLPSGSIVLADFQTAGRGQPGNSWESEAAKNLTFSVLILPSDVPANMPFVISEMVSLTMKYTLDDFLADVSVKWPNDIYVKDRKIAGILIENTIINSKISKSIIGIGINVNQTVFHSNAPNPVSMAQITGLRHDRLDVMDRFLSVLAEQNNRLNKMQFDSIHQDYLDTIYRKAGFHKFRDRHGVFEAEILNIEPGGRLILKRSDNSLSKYAFKEVTYI
jgi:BirA family biotin operon repressor/biotin-[acetyl-CoA-carboxylase] ligase